MLLLSRWNEWLFENKTLVFYNIHRTLVVTRNKILVLKVWRPAVALMTAVTLCICIYVYFSWKWSECFHQWQSYMCFSLELYFGPCHGTGKLTRQHDGIIQTLKCTVISVSRPTFRCVADKWYIHCQNYRESKGGVTVSSTVKTPGHNTNRPCVKLHPLRSKHGLHLIEKYDKKPI